jgi:uncharacterized membrane protein
MSTGKIVTAIAIATTIFAVTLGLNWAEAEGMVSADMSVRAAIVMAGLALAWFGNEIPKAIIHSASARTARRFSGWAFTLAGLASAAGAALLPVDMAITAELAITGGALALVLIYCLTTRQDPQATA